MRKGKLNGMSEENQPMVEAEQMHQMMEAMSNQVLVMLKRQLGPEQAIALLITTAARLAAWNESFPHDAVELFYKQWIAAKDEDDLAELTNN